MTCKVSNEIGSHLSLSRLSQWLQKERKSMCVLNMYALLLARFMCTCLGLRKRLRDRHKTLQKRMRDIQVQQIL